MTTNDTARGDDPGRLGLRAALEEPGGETGSDESSTVLAERYQLERLIDWHLAATRRHELAGRLDPALHHLGYAVRWVRLRPDPVAGHGARVALGLGVRS